jgi:hypothetical protein
MSTFLVGVQLIERVGDARVVVAHGGDHEVDGLRSRISGERRPTMPRSTRPMTGASGVPEIKMLPGCGSAWKKPSSKIILMMTATEVLAIFGPSWPCSRMAS